MCFSNHMVKQRYDSYRIKYHGTVPFVYVLNRCVLRRLLGLLLLCAMRWPIILSDGGGTLCIMHEWQLITPMDNA